MPSSPITMSTCRPVLLPCQHAAQSCYHVNMPPSPVTMSTCHPVLLPCQHAAQSCYHVNMPPSPVTMSTCRPVLLPCQHATQSCYHVNMPPQGFAVTMLEHKARPVLLPNCSRTMPPHIECTPWTIAQQCNICPVNVTMVSTCRKQSYYTFPDAKGICTPSYKTKLVGGYICVHYMN